MAPWRGDAMLVRHRCGARMWIRWINPATVEFRAFAIVGRGLWVGDVVTICECGRQLIPFLNSEWSET